MPRLLAIILAVLLVHSISSTVSAQPSADTPPARHLRVLTYELELIEATLRANGGGGARSVQLPPYIPGPYLELPASATEIEFTFRLRFDHSEKPIFHKVSARLPAAGTHDLVILHSGPPSPDGAKTFLARVVPEDAALFPAGHVRLVNMLPAAAAAKIGSELVTLAPGEIKLAPASLDKRNRAIVQVAVGHNGEWRELSREILVLGREMRGSMLIVQSASGLGIMHFDREVLHAKSDNQLHIVAFSEAAPAPLSPSPGGPRTASVR